MSNGTPPHTITQPHHHNTTQKTNTTTPQSTIHNPHHTTRHHTTKNHIVTDTVPAKLLERATPLNHNLDEANIFRFDVESYSLKYVKCQMIEMFMIEMFTDEVAEQAGQNGDGYVYDTVL